jgi:NAD(P)-dependent dehydrogenase (short-subunit alcohol dehydrogenase family)
MEEEHNVIGVLTDVSKAESVDNLAKRTLDEYGGMHILCNNAGVFGANDIVRATNSDWDWVLGVNFWGVVYGIRTFLPIMIEQGEEAHIVNTASVAGLVPSAGPYGISKHAVVSTSESLYFQLRQNDSKVGVSVLCPSFVNTSILDAGRNRPKELHYEAELELTELQRERRDMMTRGIQGGAPPGEVADIVLKGILEERFYILTDTMFDDMIRERMENILERRNPEYSLGPSSSTPTR